LSSLTAEMIVDATYPENIQVSPDGSRIAYMVTSSSRKEAHPAGAIWVARTGEAGSATRLTAGTALDGAPRWAPDGTALFFLSDRTKRDCFQLYRIPLDGGEAEALTEWEPGIESAVPLPGGTTVALLAVDPDSEDDKKRKEERNDAEVYGERWPRMKVRLLDLATREVTTVDALGERHIAEITPSPDGTRLAVVASPTPELDTVFEQPEILVVDVAARTATSAGNGPPGAGQLAWGPGARELLMIGFLASGGQGGQTVFAMDATGGAPRPVLPALEACAGDLVASQDGTPYVLMEQGFDSWIGRLDPATHQLDRLHDLPGNAWSLSVSANGEVTAVGRSTHDAFASIWAGPVGGTLQQMAEFAPDLKQITWGQQERLTWRALDGLVIEGLLILPVGARRGEGPFPLMTLVHGGPYGRFTDEIQLGWHDWGQWLATVGYAVLLPNPRGGSGRGADFADRVAGAVGQEDWADIEAGIDYLIAEGIADPERLGIGGWSQGGFMTAWAVGQTRRFKLGIMGAGVSDWGMMTATSDLPTFELALGGSAPWDGIGPHRHHALSPIAFAATVTTPVLILHGADDARVPASQGRFFAQALRQHGVPCELVTYPREPHGIRERNHQLDLLRRVRQWVARWLGPGWTS
jgi:dipeptidyl aminopeptidase/acylaminoacyl peptidase